MERMQTIRLEGSGRAARGGPITVRGLQTGAFAAIPLEGGPTAAVVHVPTSFVLCSYDGLGSALRVARALDELPGLDTPDPILFAERIRHHFRLVIDAPGALEEPKEEDAALTAEAEQVLADWQRREG